MKYEIIVNPVANRGRSKELFKKMTDIMDFRGTDYSKHFTEYPGHATIISERISHMKDVYNIIIFGGDGTYNEVVNGCIGEDVNLAFVPGGSCNDFTKELGVWEDIESFLDGLCGDQLERVDVGRVNDRYFLNNTGAGFDAKIIEDMIARNMKGNLGYVLMVFKNLFQFKCFNATIETEERTVDSDILLLTVNNATSYGGGFKIAPLADIQDSILDICYISSISKMKFIVNFPKVYSGDHLEIEEVEYWKSSKVHIETDRNLSIQIDGDLLPDKLNCLDIEVIPDAINVYKYREKSIS